LTPARRYATLPLSRKGWSFKTPTNSGTRTRQHAVFLCPHHAFMYGREGDGYNTRKGKQSRSSVCEF